jgi:beta-glucosidase
VVHRNLARQAVRESLVLLKNERSTLPLRKDLHRVHLAGVHANNLGYQCGGWTITWRGGSGATTQGTTILDGIRATVSPGTEVTYSIDGSGAEGADAAIAVIGERPYAEYLGDRRDLAIEPQQIELVRRLAQTGVPLVVVLVTGRPLILGEVLDLADALVVAWLPGTEGQGVADVLFGDWPPTGKLSFSWPRAMDEIPLNVGDPVYDPLFPFGFGLTYSR